MAVMLSMLPFFSFNKEKIYIYTQTEHPTKSETKLIEEVQQKNFKVIINSSLWPEEKSYGLWFKDSPDIEKIQQSKANINFVYTEVFAAIEWKRLVKPIVIITPYRELYEHYIRSNIPTVQAKLGRDFTADRLIEVLNWIKQNQKY